MASDITPEAIGFLSAVGVFIVALAVLFLFINKKLCFSNVGGLPCLEHHGSHKMGRVGVLQGLVNSYGDEDEDDDDDAASSSDSEEEVLKQFEISVSRSQSFRCATASSGLDLSHKAHRQLGRRHRFKRLSDQEEGSTGPSDCEGANKSSFIPSFTANMSSLSPMERHLLGLHKVVVIMLPLSLVLLVFGWIFGLVSSLVCSPRLLAASASYFLLCSVFTLAGVCVYIQYSNQAMEEIQRTVPPENLVFVHVSFGWSLALAWLSYSLEVATGLLLLLAARITQLKGLYDSGVVIAML